MLVGGVAVKATIPARLEPDIWIIHGLQIQIVDGSGLPDIGRVAVDGLGDGIVNIDVEDMPLSLY